MNTLRVLFRLGLLIGLAIAMEPTPTAAQTASPKEAQPRAPGLRKLTGENEKRAEQLDEQINKALKADRWDEAIARALELLALRTRAQGPKHYETVSLEWRLRALRRLAPMPLEDRAAYRSLATTKAEAQALNEQGKYVEGQKLYDKALEINRRLLTDLHPDTAASCISAADNLSEQGKYAQAQLLFEKALEIDLRLLTEDHPETATCYNGVAHTLFGQSKFAEAQRLFEKGLLIRRRLLGDDHFDTSTSYNNVAMSLSQQGRYAEAQPLIEKALEMRRRLLTGDRIEIAQCHNNLASNLDEQGKYAQAQVFYEKALEMARRLLTDNHPRVAFIYDNVATNLNRQGKFAEAQPLLEKALAIYVRQLTENHPLTANAYNDLAMNLYNQGKFTQPQALFEKGLEIRRRLLTDDHSLVAESYENAAMNLAALGEYARAEPLLEKSLEIYRRRLTDGHLKTTIVTNKLASDLAAQGKYTEARDRWLGAARSMDKARLRFAFTGLERAGGNKASPRPALAAVQARLGRPAEAWQSLEEDLGRGLLDELAARRDRRITPAERDRLRELAAELERLDRLVGTTPKGLDQAGPAQRFEELKRRRELASIALGEFQAKLVREHDALAGEVAGLGKIQAALPADAALVAWVDIAPAGPNAADPDGEHWGVIVRSRGIPDWVPIAGTGPVGLWTKVDNGLARQVRTELRSRPGDGPADLQSLVERLRAQRIEPLAKALGATADGLPPAARLVVLPSRAMAGIPVEALLAPGDTRTVSYAPSATVFKYLREQPRPDRHAGLLALGDPVYERPDESSDPKLLPDHGLLVNVAVRGSNAANHGLNDGDVLLAYNGQTLNKKDDLKVVAEGDKPIAIEVWRNGFSSRRDLAPGKLGVLIDPQPAPVAITEQRKLHQVLKTARSGDGDFAPLPGTRREVNSLVQLFRSDNRPTRALLGTDASEPELDRLAAANELGQFAFIHLATHGVIDEGVPTHSSVILTQTGLPDPLEQALNHKPVFDGRLSVREIQHAWDLKAELVTLSACETALGRNAGGEGFVGFTQALLMSGARSVCLSLWKVDDKATSLLMTRFYQNLLGKRPALSKPMPKAEALHEAKQWLRSLTADQIDGELASLQRGDVRPLAKVDGATSPGAATLPKPSGKRPYDHPYFWAAFVLVGDPD